MNAKLLLLVSLLLVICAFVVETDAQYYGGAYGYYPSSYYGSYYDGGYGYPYYGGGYAYYGKRDAGFGPSQQNNQ